MMLTCQTGQCCGSCLVACSNSSSSSTGFTVYAQQQLLFPARLPQVRISS